MLNRVGVVVGLSIAVIVAAAVPAFGDDGYGFTDCSQYPNPGCELGAGNGGANGNGDPGGGNGDPGNHGNTNPGTGQAAPNGDTIIGENNLAQCGYELSGYQGPAPSGAQPAAFHVQPRSDAGIAMPALYRSSQSDSITVQLTLAQPRLIQDEPPSGAWYVYKCTGPGVQDALYRPPVWIANGQSGPAQLPSPAELATLAHNQLRLPTPKIKANPAGDQLVSLPTWMWLDPSSWGDVSATAAVPGVSVTAVAKPTSVTWSMGDGGSVTCTGPGSQFPTGGNPKSASPDCGYTYRTSSAGQRAEAFPVSATVNWTVTWSGAGQGGTFPNMTTTGNAAFRVAESQGIATG